MKELLLGNEAVAQGLFEAGVRVVSKSYTVQIDEEERDVTYSFTDLVKEEPSTISGNTVSGNKSVSGN